MPSIFGCYVCIEYTLRSLSRIRTSWRVVAFLADLAAGNTCSRARYASIRRFRFWKLLAGPWLRLSRLGTGKSRLEVAGSLLMP